MSGEGPPVYLWVLIVPGAAAGFVLFWLGVTFLVGRCGGWHSLAREHTREGEMPGEDLGIGSLSLGRGIFATNYNGAVRLFLGPEGLGLRTVVLFRAGHPPLLIRWERVEACERRRAFLAEVTALRLRDGVPELLLRGAAGQRVYDFWQGRGRRRGG